ncbi:MAG: tRNA (adenosine(37)-N6)-threonylcarbamoyltransferase complex dimerization subunit type 1 TsaB [Candidatus Saelkia tenebricola]|nr:tRNA (adenosine(37)-N6)-threonylcarbamoyltransferase complex dimerization subunit type 1 TsaB [Candidatus Saelkia tenebricola]
MILLGIDTSSDWLHVVAGEDDKVINSISICRPKQHVSILHSSIDEVLKKTGFNIKDVDVFVVVKGPGSFTGIRIAVTTVKGFAYALDKRVVSLSSLDLLAQNALDSEERLIVPLIDAKRGQVYAAYYTNDNNIAIGVKDSMLVKIGDVLDAIDEPVVLLGDGVEAYKREIEEIRVHKKISILNEDYWILRNENIIKLGYRKYQDKGGENIFDLKPLYLYPKECTIRKNLPQR